MKNKSTDCCCPIIPSFALEDCCNNKINPEQIVKELEIRFQDIEGFKTWFLFFDTHLLRSAQMGKLTVSIYEGILEIKTDSVYKRFHIYVEPIKYYR